MKLLLVVLALLSLTSCAAQSRRMFGYGLVASGVVGGLASAGAGAYAASKAQSGEAFAPSGITMGICAAAAIVGAFVISSADGVEHQQRDETSAATDLARAQLAADCSVLAPIGRDESSGTSIYEGCARRVYCNAQRCRTERLRQ